VHVVDLVLFIFFAVVTGHLGRACAAPRCVSKPTRCEQNASRRRPGLFRLASVRM